MKLIFIFTTLVACASAQWDANFANDRFGIVHLFEWHWDTIADECETVFQDYKIGGVQTSPPNENRVIDNRPWWERYQPISYILGTRSGDRNAFINMVQRCNAAGVRIYPDIVINHMCGNGGSGTGTAGSPFNADIGKESFPGVPYGPNDFNSKDKCGTSNGEIQNYGDANEVRNCMLVGLLDLNQGTDYVRGEIIAFMNDLIDIGVAGFRVDACKHMWPGDLEVIFGNLRDLNSNYFGTGKRAYIFSEVIDQGGEPITASEYTGLGSVTEFKYGLNLANNKNSLQNLKSFGEAWGMLPGSEALAFINNHDNQRGHGGGGSIVTFKDSYDLKILTAFMLAWPYGVPRVMSSYYFDDPDQGPPSSQRGVNGDGSCSNGWVCEHRWRQIRNMFGFSTAVIGTSMNDWWDNGNNQIAFARENKGFIAINRAGYDMSENLQTGLPQGTYCNVINGDYTNGGCGGECIAVGTDGKANIFIAGDSSDPIVAIHANARSDTCNTGESGGGGTGTGTGTGGGSSTTCVDCTCTSKIDCGDLTSTEASCEADGCMWCESQIAGEPWCFYTADTTPSGGDTDCTDCSCDNKYECGYLGMGEYECQLEGCVWCDHSCIMPSSDGNGDGSLSCNVADSSKQDCGYLGIGQAECEYDGCCWSESNSNGVPWCYFPA